MSKRMRRRSNTRNAHLLPEYLEIPVQVPNGDLCIVLRTEDIGVHRGQPLCPPPEGLTKFITEGYTPVFSTFATYFNDKVVHIYCLSRQSKNPRSTKPGIKNGKRNEMRSAQIDGDWSVRENGPSVFC